MSWIVVVEVVIIDDYTFERREQNVRNRWGLDGRLTKNPCSVDGPRNRNLITTQNALLATCTVSTIARLQLPPDGPFL